jgi:iron-sulfur cluster insertion protein
MTEAITQEIAQESPILTQRSPIFMTDSATAKVAELIAAEGNPVLKLRIYVSGGGCSGLMYNFVFDEKVEDDDAVIEKDEITLLIDAMSFQYMAGAEVDFEEGLEGARFLIKNPNASSSRGCGSSFAA